jgi:hypothetical protein
VVLLLILPVVEVLLILSVPEVLPELDDDFDHFPVVPGIWSVDEDDFDL